MRMTLAGLVIIAITAIFSYRGFNEPLFFEQYKFSVGAIRQKREYYRLISSGFLHADWMHFIFNMLSLYFFQGIVSAAFGAGGFLIIYFGSMLLGNAFSLFLYKDQPWYSAIGASGAVSGVIFAAIALNPDGISVNFLPALFFLLGLYAPPPKALGQSGALRPLGRCSLRTGLYIHCSYSIGDREWIIPHHNAYPDTLPRLYPL